MPLVADRNRKVDAEKVSQEDEEIVDVIKEIMKRCDQISSRSANGKQNASRRK